jgi:hypothetical protein
LRAKWLDIVELLHAASSLRIVHISSSRRDHEIHDADDSEGI